MGETPGMVLPSGSIVTPLQDTDSGKCPSLTISEWLGDNVPSADGPADERAE